MLVIYFEIFKEKIDAILFNVNTWAFDRERKQVPEAPLPPPHLGSGHKALPPQVGLLPRLQRGQERDLLLPEACVQVTTRGWRGPRPRRRPLLTYSKAPILIFLGQASRNKVPETHLRDRGSSRSAAQAASLRKPTKAGSTSSSRAPSPSSPFPARSIVLSRSSGG